MINYLKIKTVFRYIKSKPVIIIMLAFFIRLGWVIFSPALPVSDFRTFHGLALRLAKGMGYVTGNGTPTAFRPPGYPAFLAVIYWLTNNSLLAAKLMNVLLSTLVCWLTYLLAHKIFGKKIAILSAFIIALFPSQILYTSLLATENLFTPLLLGSTFFFLVHLQDRRLVYLLLAGGLLGLSAMARPTSLLTPGIWLLFMIWRKYSLRKSLLTITILSLATLLVITPWIVRNALVMDAFIPTATEGGVGFFCGYNEKADGHYDPYARRLVNQIGDELNLNEVEREELAYRLAFEFIRENPHKVILLAPLNLFHLFRDDVSGVVWNFVETTRPLSQMLWYILVGIAQFYYMGVMLLAIVGFFHWYDFPDDGWYGLLVANLLYRICFHLFFVGDDRYHHSVMPIVAIFAAFGLTWVIQRWNVHSHLLEGLS